MGIDVLHDDAYKMLLEAGYSEKAIQYFHAKENIGTIEDADQITKITGPCGDTIKICLNVDDEKVSDAKIQVFGCPGAVASGCAVINLVKGKTLEQARQIDIDVLYKELEKLPDKKIHCARLAVKTLQKTLEEYSKNNNGSHDRVVNESWERN